MSGSSEHDLPFMSAEELATAFRARRLSPVEVTEALLDRIEAVNPLINAFSLVLGDRALKAAKESERRYAEATARSPLDGVPITVKDVTPIDGVRTTFGSKAFADYIPRASSILYERVEATGAVVLGKTTTPEFAFKAVTESPLTGITNNPWDLSRTAGGSSGGAAAAVASGLGPLATGSDGAGSIRVPAALCGVVGLKPSHGRIPLFGEDHVFETTTQVGPITRSVSDAALLLSLLAGPDPRDPFSIGESGRSLLAQVSAGSSHDVRVAYSPNLGLDPVSQDIVRLTEEAARALTDELGAVVEPIDEVFPDVREMMHVVWPPVADLLVQDELRPRVSEDAIDASLLALSAQGRTIGAREFYRRAVVHRSEVYQRIAAFFGRYDLLLTPTVPFTAFTHPAPGGQGPPEMNGVPSDPWMGWMFLTAPFNFTGFPAASIPCGFSEGLPVGLQVIGGWRADVLVLAAASAYERVHPWREMTPPLP